MGDPIIGTEAYRIGIINRVVPEGEVMDEARKLARTLGQERLPLAQQAAKTYIQIGLQMELSQATDYMLKRVEVLPKSEDHAEGRQAFIEKRKPVWQGK